MKSVCLSCSIHCLSWTLVFALNLILDQFCYLSKQFAFLPVCALAALLCCPMILVRFLGLCAPISTFMVMRYNFAYTKKEKRKIIIYLLIRLVLLPLVLLGRCNPYFFHVIMAYTSSFLLQGYPVQACCARYDILSYEDMIVKFSILC